MKQRCRTTRSRRGAALIIALACLTAIMAIGVSVARYALSERKQLRLQAGSAQASLLAESGIARAAARLTSDGKYQGETWQISKDDLGGDHTATVVIAVDAVEGKPQERVLRATAEYPAGEITASRRTLSVPFTLPAAGDAS